jgi:hypothetical protein
LGHADGHPPIAAAVLGATAASFTATTRYEAKCGEVELAGSLIKEESGQLRQIAEICRCWQETIAEATDELTP